MNTSQTVGVENSTAVPSELISWDQLKPNTSPIAYEGQSGVSVKLISDMEAFLSLEEEWLSLENDTTGTIFFQSWHWNREFMLHSSEGNSYAPFILTASKAGKLIAVLPLAFQSTKGCRLLTGLSEPYQQYTDMLCADDQDPREIFLQWMPIIKAAGVDYLHLGQVREDSSLARAMTGLVQPSGEKDAAPFVQLSNWDSFEDYYKSIKTKTRKNMRNARNRLEKTAPINHAVHYDGDGVGEIIDRTFQSREAWLARMGLTSRAFGDADFVRFLARFKSGKDGSKNDNGLKIMATSLKHGDHPIADQWGFVHKDRYYAFISGWDESYEQSSPGKLHLGAIIEECYNNNVVAADFMIPAVPYKSTWAANSVGVQDYILPLTIKGYLLNRLWHNFMRPLAKIIAYKLSPKTRAMIFKLLSRN